MLKAEQVPDDVWHTAMSTYHKAIRKRPGKAWQEAIAAAINAWPGMLTGANAVGTKQGGGTGTATDAIVLPLPLKETSA